MEQTIKVLKIEPGKAPYVKDIPDSLEGSQSEVEGLIDVVQMGDGCIAVVNDEFLINGMEPNRWCGDRIICGPFFICGDSVEGDFISLTEEQIEAYSREFGEIPKFTGQETELIPGMTVLAF